MRVEVKPDREYAWFIRPFFWLQQRNYGQVLIPGKCWGRSPRLFAAVATLYGAWLIYAGGLSFLLMSMILYAPGIAFFVYARRERGLPAFVTGVEKGFAGLIVTLALVALYMIASGQLAL